MIIFRFVRFLVHFYTSPVQNRFFACLPTDDDPEFRTFLVDSMRNFSDSAGHSAFFWECKPVSRIGLSATSFEYVLIPSTELEGNFNVFLSCSLTYTSIAHFSYFTLFNII